MPALSNKDKRSLPRVTPPPVYNTKTTDNDHGTPLPQRRMGQYGGLPQGPSRNRHGDRESADPFNEWNPGEFQRSYPKTDARNAAWYKMHRYGRLPGKDFDGWQRIAGPPAPPKKAGPPSPVQKAAKVAAAKKTGRAASPQPSRRLAAVPAKAAATGRRGSSVASSAARAAGRAVGKMF